MCRPSSLRFTHCILCVFSPNARHIGHRSAIIAFPSSNITYPCKLTLQSSFPYFGQQNKDGENAMLTIAITILISSILRHAVANRTTANDRSVPYASSVLRTDGPFAPIKNQTIFSACFLRRKTTVFRSLNGWLSKRSRVCD